MVFGRDPPVVPLPGALVRKATAVAAGGGAVLALLHCTGVLGTLVLAPAGVAAAARVVLVRRLPPGIAVGVMCFAGLFLDAFLPCWGMFLGGAVYGTIDVDFWVTEALAAAGGMALAFVVEHEGRPGPRPR